MPPSPGTGLTPTQPAGSAALRKRESHLATTANRVRGCPCRDGGEVGRVGEQWRMLEAELRRARRGIEDLTADLHVREEAHKAEVDALHAELMTLSTAKEKNTRQQAGLQHQLLRKLSKAEHVAQAAMSVAAAAAGAHSSEVVKDHGLYGEMPPIDYTNPPSPPPRKARSNKGDGRVKPYAQIEEAHAMPTGLTPQAAQRAAPHPRPRSMARRARRRRPRSRSLPSVRAVLR